VWRELVNKQGFRLVEGWRPRWGPRLPGASVVGVVADTKMGSRDEPSEDQWYTPMELWSSPRLRTALVKPESSVTLSVDT